MRGKRYAHQIKYTDILLLIAVLITGCSGDYISSIYDSDIKISSSTNSYNLTGAIQTIEDGKFIGQVKKFEGMDTIWTYEAAEDGALEVPIY